jgi:hypothetical protein
VAKRRVCAIVAKAATTYLRVETERVTYMHLNKILHLRIYHVYEFLIAALGPRGMHTDSTIHDINEK